MWRLKMREKEKEKARNRDERSHRAKDSTGSSGAKNFSKSPLFNKNKRKRQGEKLAARLRGEGGGEGGAATVAAISDSTHKTEKTATLKGLSGSSDQECGMTLEEQPWYFGLWPRSQLMSQLKKDGTFLCRLSQDARGQDSLVITVSYQGSLVHTPIMISEGKHHKLLFSFDGQAYDSVFALVKVYVKERIPLNRGTEIFLERGARRPDYCIRHKDVDEKDLLSFVVGGRGREELWRGVWKVPLPTPCLLRKAATEASDEERARMVNEAKNLSHLQSGKSSDLIVKLYGLCGDRAPMQLIFEPFGTALDERLTSKEHPPLSERTVIRLSILLMGILEFLTERKILHRNIRAKSLRMDNTGHLKLASFQWGVRGLEWKVSEDEPWVEGGTAWSAPEILTAGVYSTASEMWAAAVTIWEIANAGQLPFPDVAEADLSEAIIRGDRVEFTSADLNRIVGNVWDANPQSRPSPAQLISQLQPLFHKVPSQDVFLHKGQFNQF